MKCNIPPVPVAYLDVSQSPEIGVETRLSYSRQPMTRLCIVQQDDVDSGVLTPDPTYLPPATGNGPALSGSDVQLACASEIVSLEPIQVTLGVMFDDGTLGSGIGIIQPSALQLDQGDGFPVVTAADLQLLKAGVDVTLTRSVNSVTSLLSIVGGDVGNQFYLLDCPDLASYTLVQNVNNRDVQVPVSKAVNIPSGYDGARWIKKGRSEPPKLDIKANYIGFGQGLPRIAGQRVTIMMETWKDDRVLTERMIVGGYRPDVKIGKPDGNGMAEATATGEFETGSFAVFQALAGV